MGWGGSLARPLESDITVDSDSPLVISSGKFRKPW